jgi:beta-alanine degradation protein BauB
MKSFASGSGQFAGLIAVMMVLCASPARAQDPVKTDPAHYKLELENDRVRVIHITVEPNGKLEVNELGDAVVVPLRDYESTLKMANGPTKVERVAGKPAWVPAGRREVEAGARGVDALLIEIKPAAK